MKPRRLSKWPLTSVDASPPLWTRHSLKLTVTLPSRPRSRFQKTRVGRKWERLDGSVRAINHAKSKRKATTKSWEWVVNSQKSIRTKHVSNNPIIINSWIPSTVSFNQFLFFFLYFYLKITPRSTREKQLLALGGKEDTCRFNSSNRVNYHPRHPHPRSLHRGTMTLKQETPKLYKNCNRSIFSESNTVFSVMSLTSTFGMPHPRRLQPQPPP